MIIAKRNQLVTFSLLLILLFLVQTSLSAPKSYRIELPTRTIEESADNGVWLSQRSVDEATVVLLQFNDHPDAFAKRALGLAGVQLQEYVGGGAWVAYLPAGVDQSVFDMQDIRWAGPILESDKIDLRVAASEIPSWADTPDGILFAVAIMKNIPESEAEVLLRQAGAIP
ncbi:MAG TPA: hypothetical protein ENH10_03180, partial [Bacteroidetes bacterium]|nr:hypothetical protein [Bacteroidota bacterium]HEX04145.1 hypothetical protein [Bacteroidota bacterium]